ncbi:protein GPR107 [Cloeon dipterum]|uniref:protein GPR107 n=1 Tax=Cloeon dipterum TaxID=197152 RepID=UPI0032209BE2
MARYTLKRQKIYHALFLFLCLFVTAEARKHRLEITEDYRRFIALSTFGFYKGGQLEVKMENFILKQNGPDKPLCGFTFDRTVSDAMNPYLENHLDRCPLRERESLSQDTVTFIMDLNEKSPFLRVNCSSTLQTIRIYKNKTMIPTIKGHTSDSTLFNQRKRREMGLPVENVPHEPAASPVTDSSTSCSDTIIPITRNRNGGSYNIYFIIVIATEQDEGLYNFYYHTCPRNMDVYAASSFLIELEELNKNNYLSAGEMPLPALYFMMSLLFFLSGSFWVFIISKSKHPVFKIHYLMAVLVYLKSLSLLFHSINFHFIEISGTHVATWAVLYYIAHLLKGAVLFITIILIGTGWTFIKHILSDKDKKIFMIVIPLQVLANVAEIIIEESEEGDIEYHTWRDVFILVDLLCCGAILFPVVWSIRHLQEASQTDGKAAINLRKLKVFRHFYVMIVCYIYFTRIIVYLLKITVPFQYEWLDEMFREMATYVFFVLTGYKFRPASANPYFQVQYDDDDEEVDIVVTQSGLTEGLTNLARLKAHSSTVDSGDEEEKDNLLSKRESSHEYD